jgi:ABC-type amino acid transport substrate-binding protein
MSRGAGIMERKDRHVGPGGSWSDPYFQVKRSLLVRTDDKPAFDNYKTLSGKKIVVTRGSTADVDAQTRYPHCTIEYVDVVAKGQADAQAYIVKELIA